MSKEIVHVWQGRRSMFTFFVCWGVNGEGNAIDASIKGAIYRKGGKKIEKAILWKSHHLLPDVVSGFEHVTAGRLGGYCT